MSAALTPTPDPAVCNALRDRALRTLSELMAAEHSASDRRQAATAALRYLALFDTPRGGKSPSPPTSPPDNSPPPKPSINTSPASLKLEPLPAPALSAAPRASGRSGAKQDLSDREDHYPYRKRVRTAPSQPRGEDALADLAQRSGAQPITGRGQSPASPLSDATSRAVGNNHNHDHARAPPA